MRCYLIDQSQGSAEVQYNFVTVAGVADSHEFKLENRKLRYFHTITAGIRPEELGLSKWSHRGEWRTVVSIRHEMMCLNIASQRASFSLSFWRISTVLEFG
jgi:hypothetical protein